MTDGHVAFQPGVAAEIGMILGTAAYMTPEQAKGKSVDKRADIWAFGVVLYELLTGEQLFHGEDVADTLAQVLTKYPSLERTPPQVRKLLGRCLNKDPKQRLRDIGEARFWLDESNSIAAPLSLPRRINRIGLLGWLAAGAFAVLAAVLLWESWRIPPAAPQVMRLQIAIPESQSPGLFALSPLAATSPFGRPVRMASRASGSVISLLYRLGRSPAPRNPAAVQLQHLSGLRMAAFSHSMQI